MQFELHVNAVWGEIVIVCVYKSEIATLKIARGSPEDEKLDYLWRRKQYIPSIYRFFLA